VAAARNVSGCDAAKQKRPGWGSQKPGYVIGDQGRLRLERGKGGAKRGVTLVGSLVEAVVRGSLLGHLPDAFNGIELGRVRRQTEQLDAVAVGHKPTLADRIEVVAGAVVDDQERFASPAPTDDLLEEGQKRTAVEYRRELVEKPWPFLQRDDAEDVRRLAHAEGIYAGLAADACPGLMERTVEPEAGFVAVGNDPSALARFFLIVGRVSRSHVA
jgi:hypothetical protein